MSEHADHSRIGAVEVFSAGTHRGKPYTEGDLADIVRNFRQFSSPSAQQVLLNVPVVIGHEEDQEYLQRTDLPAAGWVVDLWQEGGSLFADFEHVPPEVARLVKGKTYRMVSAEIYDEPPDGIPARGKMLRRVALLGADVPEVKGLAEIPTPEPSSYSEGAARRVGPATGFVACFTETRRPRRKARRHAEDPEQEYQRARRLRRETLDNTPFGPDFDRQDEKHSANLADLAHKTGWPISAQGHERRRRFYDLDEPPAEQHAEDPERQWQEAVDEWVRSDDVSAPRREKQYANLASAAGKSGRRSQLQELEAARRSALGRMPDAQQHAEDPEQEYQRAVGEFNNDEDGDQPAREEKHYANMADRSHKANRPFGAAVNERFRREALDRMLDAAAQQHAEDPEQEYQAARREYSQDPRVLDRRLQGKHFANLANLAHEAGRTANAGTWGRYWRENEPTPPEQHAEDDEPVMPQGDLFPSAGVEFAKDRVLRRSAREALHHLDSATEGTEQYALDRYDKALAKGNRRAARMERTGLRYQHAQRPSKHAEGDEPDEADMPDNTAGRAEDLEHARRLHLYGNRQRLRKNAKENYGDLESGHYEPGGKYDQHSEAFAELPEETSMNQPAAPAGGPDREGMKRDMRRALEQLGVDGELLGQLDERLLAEMLRILDQQQQQQQQPMTPGGDQAAMQGQQQMDPGSAAPGGTPGMPEDEQLDPSLMAALTGEQRFAEGDEDDEEDALPGGFLPRDRVRFAGRMQNKGKPPQGETPLISPSQSRPPRARGRGAGDYVVDENQQGVADGAVRVIGPHFMALDVPQSTLYPDGHADDPYDGSDDELWDYAEYHTHPGITPKDEDDGVYAVVDPRSPSGPDNPPRHGVRTHRQMMPNGQSRWEEVEFPGPGGRGTRREVLDPRFLRADGSELPEEHDLYDFNEYDDTAGDSQAALDRRRRHGHSDRPWTPSEGDRGHYRDLESEDGWAWEQGGTPGSTDTRLERYADGYGGDMGMMAEDDDAEDESGSPTYDSDPRVIDANPYTGKGGVRVRPTGQMLPGMRDDGTIGPMFEDTVREDGSRPPRYYLPGVGMRNIGDYDPANHGQQFDEDDETPEQREQRAEEDEDVSHMPGEDGYDDERDDETPRRRRPDEDEDMDDMEDEPSATMSMMDDDGDDWEEHDENGKSTGGRAERGRERRETQVLRGQRRAAPRKSTIGRDPKPVAKNAEDDEDRKGKGKGRREDRDWRRWDYGVERHGEREGTVLRETIDGHRTGGGKKALGLYTGGVMKLSEVVGIVQRVATRVAREAVRSQASREAAGLRKFSEQITRREKRRAVDAILDRLTAEGRLLPAEKDMVRGRLMRADATEPVARFSEKGKQVAATEFDLQVKELERRPTVFGELMKQPGTAAGGEDREVEKLEAHYEQFSEQFQRVGTTKEDMVKAFKAKRRMKPGVTAEQFLEARG